jgi:hypothetical protein
MISVIVVVKRRIRNRESENVSQFGRLSEKKILKKSKEL